MTTEADASTRPAVACRCCGSVDVVLRGSKRGTFLNRNFDFWHCPACDYLFVDPFPGYGVYDEAYYSGKGADPYVDYESEFRDYRATWRILELDDLWRLASSHMEASFPPGEVSWLDFGCGAGGLIKYLRDRGTHEHQGRTWTIKASGHDVGSYAEKLSKEPRFTMRSHAELAAMPAASFDIISLIEVVEHVEFPDPVFALVARLLKPGGLLLVTTGNIASAVARREGLGYGFILPEVHVGYFTPTALERIYSRHGLSPVLLRYDGAIRFKVIKTLRDPMRQKLASLVLRIPLAVRLVDLLYGTSAMPCATKPRQGSVAQ